LIYKNHKKGYVCFPRRCDLVPMLYELSGYIYFKIKMLSFKIYFLRSEKKIP
jgi:hypothetical protein